MFIICTVIELFCVATRRTCVLTYGKYFLELNRVHIGFPGAETYQNET